VTYKLTRQEAYSIVDSEREYQEMRVKRDNGAGLHSPEEMLLYMEEYLADARKTAATTWGPQSRQLIMDKLRKVTGLGVAAIEMHGAPRREGF
jgi:hypothetical protein